MDLNMDQCLCCSFYVLLPLVHFHFQFPGTCMFLIPLYVSYSCPAVPFSLFLLFATYVCAREEPQKKN